MKNPTQPAHDITGGTLVATGPNTISSMWNGLRFLRQPFAVLDRAEKDYGPIVRFQIGKKRVLHLIHEPEHVQHVLLDNNRNYVKCTPYGLLKLLFGRGLLFNEGDSWFSQRRLMQPAFQAGSFSAMADSTQQVIESTAQQWSRLEDGQKTDLDTEMAQVARRIVGQVLFGMDLPEDINTILQLEGSKLGFLMGNLPLTPQHVSFKKAIRLLDESVYGIIAERRKNPEAAPNDILAALLRAVDRDTGEVMSDQQLRDEIVTLLFSGFDTTSRTLTWTFHALSKNPDVEARLHEELDQVLAGRAPTYADLPKLTYTEMLVKETMRMFPPNAIIGRQAKEDDVIGGYHIPAGSVITLSPYLAHRNAALWESPEVFEPQRFIDPKKDPVQRFGYFPFGGGPRQCIGKGLAMMTIPLAIATIAQRYRFCDVPDFIVEYDIKVTFQSRNGVMATRHARPEFNALAQPNPST